MTEAEQQGGRSPSERLGVLEERIDNMRREYDRRLGRIEIAIGVVILGVLASAGRALLSTIGLPA